MQARAAGSNQEILFLDPDDDLGSIRAKLESVVADEVYLVIPRRASILRAPLEFRILARLAHDLSSETIIVTGDAGRRALARQEGLRTRRSVGSLRHLNPPSGPIGRLVPSVPEWLPIPSVMSVLILGVFLAVAGLIALVVLPVMRVAVTPATQTMQRNLEIYVDSAFKTPDVAKGQLPGTLMQRRVEVTAGAATTSIRQGGRERARGEVFFVNRQGSQFLVPRGATVVARNGVRFTVDSEVRVPPFSVSAARAAITAVNPGSSGNVEPSMITQLEGAFDGLSVTNQRPTTGGTDREVRAVSGEDVNRLREQLLKRAQDQLLQELAAQAGVERSLPPHTMRVRVEHEVFDPPVEAEGDQVTGRLTVAGTATAFVNSDLNRLAQQMLLASAPGGFDLPLEQMQLSPPIVVEWADQRMQLRVAANAVLVRSIDVVTLSQELRGQSPEEAQAFLQNVTDLAGVSRIELVPPWSPRAYRVEVTVIPPK